MTTRTTGIFEVTEELARHNGKVLAGTMAIRSDIVSPRVLARGAVDVLADVPYCSEYVKAHRPALLRDFTLMMTMVQYETVDDRLCRGLAEAFCAHLPAPRDSVWCACNGVWLDAPGGLPVDTNEHVFDGCCE